MRCSPAFPSPHQRIGLTTGSPPPPPFPSPFPTPAYHRLLPAGSSKAQVVPPYTRPCLSLRPSLAALPFLGHLPHSGTRPQSCASASAFCGTLQAYRPPLPLPASPLPGAATTQLPTAASSLSPGQHQHCNPASSPPSRRRLWHNGTISRLWGRGCYGGKKGGALRREGASGAQDLRHRPPPLWARGTRLDQVLPQAPRRTQHQKVRPIPLGAPFPPVPCAVAHAHHSSC